MCSRVHFSQSIRELIRTRGCHFTNLVSFCSLLCFSCALSSALSDIARVCTIWRSLCTFSVFLCKFSVSWLPNQWPRQWPMMFHRLPLMYGSFRLAPIMNSWNVRYWWWLAFPQYWFCESTELHICKNQTIVPVNILTVWYASFLVCMTHYHVSWCVYLVGEYDEHLYQSNKVWEGKVTLETILRNRN